MHLKWLKWQILWCSYNLKKGPPKVTFSSHPFCMYRLSFPLWGLATLTFSPLPDIQTRERGPRHPCGLIVSSPLLASRGRWEVPSPDRPGASWHPLEKRMCLLLPKSVFGDVTLAVLSHWEWERSHQGDGRAPQTRAFCLGSCFQLTLGLTCPSARDAPYLPAGVGSKCPGHAQHTPRVPPAWLRREMGCPGPRRSPTRLWNKGQS